MFFPPSNKPTDPDDPGFNPETNRQLLWFGLIALVIILLINLSMITGESVCAATRPLYLIIP